MFPELSATSHGLPEHILFLLVLSWFCVLAQEQLVIFGWSEGVFKSPQK